MVLPAYRTSFNRIYPVDTTDLAADVAEAGMPRGPMSVLHLQYPGWAHIRVRVRVRVWVLVWGGRVMHLQYPDDGHPLYPEPSW